MTAGGRNDDLKALLVEASLALAGLEVAKLEELALSCIGLLREMGGESGQMTLDPSAIRRELSIFGRSVEATRANRDVLGKLRNRETPGLDYGLSPVSGTLGVGHGDH